MSTVIALNLKNRRRLKFLAINVYNDSKSEAVRALRNANLPGISLLFRVVQVWYSRCKDSTLVIVSQAIDPDYFFPSP
jgi:hypothetical protein